MIEGPLILTEGSRILWLAVAIVGLHRFGDGLVLGQAFVGIVAPNIPVDGLTVSATVAHRFAEGSLVVVPALWAGWKARPTFALLLVSRLGVPAAFIPGAVFHPSGA